MLLEEEFDSYKDILYSVVFSEEMTDKVCLFIGVTVMSKLQIVVRIFLLCVSCQLVSLILHTETQHGALTMGWGGGSTDFLSLKGVVCVFVQLPNSTSKRKMKMKLTLFSVCWSYV